MLRRETRLPRDHTWGPVSGSAPSSFAARCARQDSTEASWPITFAVYTSTAHIHTLPLVTHLRWL